MVRVGGLTYRCNPTAATGQRITDMRLAGEPIQADKTYKVAGWAPVAEGATGEPIWDVVETWLRANPVVGPRQINTPELVGVANDPGMMS